MDSTKEKDMELRYYAAAAVGRRWHELLVIRRDGRQVSQEPTGVIFKSTKEMQTALAARNRR